MIILQYRIYRSDLELNPDVIYCFGDNDQREGRGGQARECRGEINAVGIRTKKTPGVDESAYYTDDELEENCQKITEDFLVVLNHLLAGTVVVFPTEGFGTGFAELKERAPLTLEYIQRTVENLVREHGR
jgi:hypothetical protein